MVYQKVNYKPDPYYLDDKSVREEIIREEEAKENQILENENEMVEDETLAPLIEPNKNDQDLEKVLLIFCYSNFKEVIIFLNKLK